MTSGDIDDKLESAEWLVELREGNAEFNAYLIKAWQFRPVRTFFIPFGAGISEDGQRVYISHDIQTIIDGVECENALVRHETTEWALRKFCSIGVDYLTDPSGHRLANRAEHDRVMELLARENGWELYEEIINPQVILDEREEFEDLPIPQDLALYPYEDVIANNLYSAMRNERSKEEWDKIS